jgi:hypothetical protein
VRFRCGYPQGMNPSQKARRVGFTMLGAIVAVLLVFLAITWLEGDPTNHLEEHQPSPSPSPTS